MKLFKILFLLFFPILLLQPVMAMEKFKPLQNDLERFEIQLPEKIHILKSASQGGRSFTIIQLPLNEVAAFAQAILDTCKDRPRYYTKSKTYFYTEGIVKILPQRASLEIASGTVGMDLKETEDVPMEIAQMWDKEAATWKDQTWILIVNDSKSVKEEVASLHINAKTGVIRIYLQVHPKK